MKRTILYEDHVALGAKMVEFAGYEMPIEYSSLNEEHAAVRNNCGVFDVSHMGEILITGSDATKFVNYLITNDVTLYQNKKMIYSVMTDDNGNSLDDLMAYKYDSNKYFLVVNASNIEKDFKWIIEHKKGFEVVITNESDKYSQLALQGPESIKIMKLLTSYNLDSLKTFDFDEFEVMDFKAIVSRSGYTGEDGFEIYSEDQNIKKLFEKLLELKVNPCGLGCRDTLRFEASMPLYGHELNDDFTVLEAGFSWCTKLNKDFIGCKALKRQKEEGLSRKLVALELLDKGIARSGYDVYKNGERIGYITTGYMIPGTVKSYAFALVNSLYSSLDEILEIQIRRNMVKAKVRNKNLMEKKYIK